MDDQIIASLKKAQKNEDEMIGLIGEVILMLMPHAKTSPEIKDAVAQILNLLNEDTRHHQEVLNKIILSNTL